jgi:hypothetical protein
MNVDIASLRRKADYYATEAPDWVRTIWKRPEGFSWFLKANRSTLAADGSIIRLGRDWFVNVNQFPDAAKRILGVEVTQ